MLHSDIPRQEYFDKKRLKPIKKQVQRFLVDNNHLPMLFSKKSQNASYHVHVNLKDNVNSLLASMLDEQIPEPDSKKSQYALIVGVCGMSILIGLVAYKQKSNTQALNLEKRMDSNARKEYV